MKKSAFFICTALFLSMSVSPVFAAEIVATEQETETAQTMDWTDPVDPVKTLEAWGYDVASLQTDGNEIDLQSLNIIGGESGVNFKMYLEPDNPIFKAADTYVYFTDEDSGLMFSQLIRHYNYDLQNNVVEAFFPIPATQGFHNYWVEVWTMSNTVNANNLCYQTHVTAEADETYQLTAACGTREWLDTEGKKLLADAQNEEMMSYHTASKDAVGYHADNGAPDILGDYELTADGWVQIYDLDGNYVGSLPMEFMRDGFTPYEAYLASHKYGESGSGYILPSDFSKADLFKNNPAYEGEVPEEYLQAEEQTQAKAQQEAEEKASEFASEHKLDLTAEDAGTYYTASEEDHAHDIINWIIPIIVCVMVALILIFALKAIFSSKEE